MDDDGFPPSLDAMEATSLTSNNNQALLKCQVDVGDECTDAQEDQNKVDVMGEEATHSPHSHPNHLKGQDRQASDEPQEQDSQQMGSTSDDINSIAFGNVNTGHLEITAETAADESSWHSKLNYSVGSGTGLQTINESSLDIHHEGETTSIDRTNI